MTKEEVQQVWAAASEYRWRGFDHWWKEEGSRGPPPLYTPVPTSCREFENVNIGIYDNNRRMKETTEWIKTGERLPELEQDVLLCDSNGKCSVGYRELDWETRNSRWVYGTDGDTTLLECFPHWRPLPELPKEGKE